MRLERLQSLRDSSLLYQALLIGYGLFFAGFFLVPRQLENYHQGFYYLGIALFGLLLLPRGFQLLRGNPLFWLLSAYLLYMVASTLWSEAFSADPDAVKRSIKLLQRAAYIIVLFLITAAIREREPEKFQRMLMFVCIAAAISAVITLGLWYRGHPFPESRVWGFSLVRWTIFAAYSFGIFAVLSVYFMVRSPARWLTIALGLSFLALFTYVWLAQSRTAFGAVLIGVLVASMGTHARNRVMILLLVGFGIGVTSTLLIPSAFDYVFARGLSFRPDIWAAYLFRAMNHPIFGEGLLSDRTNFVYAPPLIGTVPDAHSAYIGTLRDGGIVGLGLLGGAFLAAFWCGVRSITRSSCYLSLALALVVFAYLATDTDRLITRTGAQWIFLWLPMALIMTSPECLKGSKAARIKTDEPPT
jgi:hypothetical protein